ncbi:MAG TPA: phosphoribosylformylglycinamidine synthase subunit PurQ, partial [Flavobacterium sp.]|nr:phosphoribosylformylglycinamidine synthase subunit PurQ [Flavobacterium sp.]
IAHGEGRYIADKKAYEDLKKSNSIALLYEKGEVNKFQNLEPNPNGSDFCIAGVLAYNGRVFGMMPHPERAMFAHQSPLWQKNGKIKGEGLGLIIFKNAVNYFK